MMNKSPPSAPSHEALRRAAEALAEAGAVNAFSCSPLLLDPRLDQLRARGTVLAIVPL
jgi:hypothetical protein